MHCIHQFIKISVNFPISFHHNNNFTFAFLLTQNINFFFYLYLSPLGGIVNRNTLSYCGSELGESEIYSAYSYCGSEFGDVNQNDINDLYQTPSKIRDNRTANRLKTRKGRSVVHKNLEDNYSAVIVANHEALAQVLEQVRL
jgi:hypothetical protein